MFATARQLAALLVCLLILPQLHAETLTGKVVCVLDGDTLEVLDGRTPHRVRLAGTDTRDSG